MLVNDLASVLRSGGVSVQEASGWKTHNHGQLNSVSCIVIHHTAGAATGDYPSYNVVRNGHPDLRGPLAQTGVGRSGKWYVFSSGVSYHAGATRQPWQNNQNSIGVEVESVGTGLVWPNAQIHAAAKGVAALCRRYGVPVSRVLGHKEVCHPVGRKIDPVGIPGDMPAFRALVSQYLAGKPDTPEKPDNEEDDNMVKFLRGDSKIKIPGTSNVWGDVVFKVEYAHPYGPIAVRTRVPNSNEPGYRAFLAAGGKVIQVPQAVLDAIPDKPVD